jgi:hypothetical protein
MIKFLSCDLPVFLNLDVEVLQALMSIYVLLLFVGFVTGTVVAFSSESISCKAVFLRFVSSEPPFLFRTTSASFALGP